MRKKATKKEKQSKIQQVLSLIGKGKLATEIVDSLSVEWGCSERNVYRYIDVLQKEILKTLSSENLKSMLLDDIRVLKEKEDYKTATRIETELLKIDTTQKIDHNITFISKFPENNIDD